MGLPPFSGEGLSGRRGQHARPPDVPAPPALAPQAIGLSAETMHLKALAPDADDWMRQIGDASAATREAPTIQDGQFPPVFIQPCRIHEHPHEVRPSAVVSLGHRGRTRSAFSETGVPFFLTQPRGHA